MEKPLLDVVSEAMENARSNGYEIDLWPAEAMAQDMCQYLSGLEDVPVADVVRAIRIIRCTR